MRLNLPAELERLRWVGDEILFTTGKSTTCKQAMWQSSALVASANSWLPRRRLKQPCQHGGKGNVVLVGGGLVYRVTSQIRLCLCYHTFVYSHLQEISFVKDNDWYLQVLEADIYPSNISVAFTVTSKVDTRSNLCHSCLFPESWYRTNSQHQLVGMEPILVETKLSHFRDRRKTCSCRLRSLQQVGSFMWMRHRERRSRERERNQGSGKQKHTW